MEVQAAEVGGKVNAEGKSKVKRVLDVACLKFQRLREGGVFKQ